MAKVSICDYCKSISKKDFNHWIDLVDYDKNAEAKEVEERFEICKNCFESLHALLKSETPLPQAAPCTLSDEGSGDSVSTNVPIPSYLRNLIHKNGAPTEALLEHEVNKVPSRRDEVEEDDATCKHKYDMQQNAVGEMYMACTKCDTRMETESIS